MSSAPSKKVGAWVDFSPTTETQGSDDRWK